MCHSYCFFVTLLLIRLIYDVYTPNGRKLTLTNRSILFLNMDINGERVLRFSLHEELSCIRIPHLLIVVTQTFNTVCNRQNHENWRITLQKAGRV